MVERFEEEMNLAEDRVCLFVFTSEIPPTFDNSIVIAVDFKMPARISKPGDCSDEELETDCFSPTDVLGTIQMLPTRDEMPGSPSIFDGDGNAEARACI